MASRDLPSEAISIVVPTLDAGDGFRHLCRNLEGLRERLGVDVLVVDSGSRDGTPERAERHGLRVHPIDPREFGHGKTRNLGVRLTRGEVVCFLTQDVLPCTPDWPVRFARALRDPGVAGVYGRQVPRDAATMEMFFVAMNYPEEPRTFDRKGALPRPGRVVFSNAFSAIRRDVWERHPFPEDVAVSEDQAWAHAVLSAGRPHRVRAGGRGAARPPVLPPGPLPAPLPAGPVAEIPEARPGSGARRGAGRVRRRGALLRAPRAPGAAAPARHLRDGTVPGASGRPLERPPDGGGAPGGMSLWRRLGRSGRNLAATASAEVVIRLVALAYLVALARFLEPDAFGVFNTVLAYFGLVVTLGNFGLDQLALRELSISERGASFATLFWLRLGAAAVSAGLLVVGARLLPTASGPLLATLAVAVIPAGVASALGAAFKARERFGVPSAASAAGTLVMAGLSFWGVAAGAPLVAFLWALVASETVRAGWLAVAARRGAEWSLAGFDRSYAGKAVRAATPYAVLAVLGVIYFRVDLIMLDAMVGGDAVGHYAGAYRVLDALVLAPGLVLAVLFPRFARGQKGGSKDTRRLYLGVSTILVWAGIVVAGAGVICAEPVLTVLFSDAYAEGRVALGWLMVALAFVFAHAPNVTVLLSGERLGPVVRWSLVTAGFNVLANLALIPRFGAAGAASATAASELLSFAVFTPMVLRRFGIDARAYLRAVSMPWMSRAELHLLLGRTDEPRVQEASHAR